MAFSFVNSSEYNSTNSWGSATVNKPSWTLDNDIMFAVVRSYNYASTSNPSWWTKLWTWPNQMELWYKVASSEPSDYTWTWSAWNITRIWIFTYRWWFDTADPIDVVSNTLYSTSNTTLRAASMSVSQENSPLVFLGMAYKTTALSFTKPSVPTTDWVEDYDWWDAWPDMYNEICSMVRTSSWATWNIDATANATPTFKHAYAVALNPSAWGWNTSVFFQLF